MDLYSCECGVVLDRDKLSFPKNIILPEDPNDSSTWGKVDLTKVEWNGDRYVRVTQCPVCSINVPCGDD